MSDSPCGHDDAHFNGYCPSCGSDCTFCIKVEAVRLRSQLVEKVATLQADLSAARGEVERLTAALEGATSLLEQAQRHRDEWMQRAFDMKVKRNEERTRADEAVGLLRDVIDAVTWSAVNDTRVPRKVEAAAMTKAVDWLSRQPPQGSTTGGEVPPSTPTRERP